MITITIIQTCLATGYNCIDTHSFSDKEYASDWLQHVLEARSDGLWKKFLSAQRRVKKGTSKGIKIFYSPRKGERIYLWIQSYESTEILGGAYGCTRSCGSF